MLPGVLSKALNLSPEFQVHLDILHWMSKMYLQLNTFKIEHIFNPATRPTPRSGYLPVTVKEVTTASSLSLVSNQWVLSLLLNPCTPLDSFRMWSGHSWLFNAYSQKSLTCHWGQVFLWGILHKVILLGLEAGSFGTCARNHIASCHRQLASPLDCNGFPASPHTFLHFLGLTTVI